MIFLLFLILLIIILREFVKSQKNTVRKQVFENRSCVIVWTIIILAAALRKHTVGADTLGYLTDYYELDQMSFPEIAERYEGYLGYYFTSKIFSLFGLPVQIWFGFVEALYVFSLSKLINKYSTDKLFSILVFVTIGLLTFSMAGMKQVMSMSLMMLSFLCFVDKRFSSALGLAIFSYLCHPASLIFLAAFPLYFLRNKKYDLFLIIGATIFVMLYGAFFMNSMVDAIDNEHFEMYLIEDRSYTSTTLIFYSVIVAVSFIYYKRYSLNRPIEAKLSLGFSVIAIGLQTLSSLSPSLFRLAYLYTPFMMILLPNTCYFCGKNRKLLSIVLIVAISFYCVYTNRGMSYSFFGQ